MKIDTYEIKYTFKLAFWQTTTFDTSVVGKMSPKDQYTVLEH